jgi:hypothetical protein
MINFIKIYFYLIPLTIINYWQRSHGNKPDEWYWADIELMQNEKSVPFWILKLFRLI